MKSFRQYIFEMYPFPIAAETQQVERIETPKNISNIGGAGQIKAQVRIEPAPTTQSAPAPIKKNSAEYDLGAIKKMIVADESAGNEKKILSRYKDNRGLPTIGHGHLIDMKKSPKIFAEVFAAEHQTNPKFGEEVLSGKKSLTPNQVDRLADRDIADRMTAVVAAFPNFKTYSSDLQANIASEWFRGMMPSSKKTIMLINQGKWADASKEYLNSMDYRRAVKENSGVKTRMDRVSNAIGAEANRVK